MSVLRVAQLGHPILRRVAREITPEELASPEIQTFLDDLLETMLDYDGAGLAAPQVHRSLRAVVLELDEEKGPEFLINPVITVLGDRTRHTWEGCLSVEGLRGRVERPDHVEVRALDRDGSRKGYELRGFAAVVVQHECDHLDGVLYLDRAEPRSLAFLREYRRFGPLVGRKDDLRDDEGLEEGEE